MHEYSYKLVYFIYSFCDIYFKVNKMLNSKIIKTIKTIVDNSVK